MGGGDWLDEPQQQMIQDVEPIAIEETVAHVEVTSSPIPDVSGWTPAQWFSFSAWIVGILVIVACFVRFTPFGEGVSKLFTTLANIAKKDGGKKR